MLACDDIMPTGWTPAAASSTLEEWTRTFSRGQQCSCFRITVFYEFGRDSRKFASGVRKYGKFSHFLTHLVVYGRQGKKTNIIFSISTANVYRLSRVKVSGTCVQPFQRYWGFGVFCGVLEFWGVLGVFGGLWVFCVFGVFGDFAVFGVLWCFGVLGVLGCFGVF